MERRSAINLKRSERGRLHDVQLSYAFLVPVIRNDRAPAEPYRAMRPPVDRSS